MYKPAALDKDNFVRCNCIGGIHGMELEYDPVFEQYYVLFWRMGSYKEPFFSRLKLAWGMLWRGKAMIEDYVLKRNDIARFRDSLNQALEHGRE